MIAALETEYRGMLFRSRLEARWAVFFDNLGVPYQYEQRGFNLPPVKGRGKKMKYLPDFWIPPSPKFPKELWVEVKGMPDGMPDSESDEKMTRLVHHTESRGTIVGGIPWFGHQGYEMCEHIDGGPDDGNIYGDSYYRFCQCPFCGSFGFEFDGRSSRIGCKCPEHAGVDNGDKTYNAESHDIMAAYAAARRERFGT